MHLFVKKEEAEGDAYRHRDKQNDGRRDRKTAQSYGIHVKEDCDDVECETDIEPVPVVGDTPILRTHIADRREEKIECDHADEDPVEVHKAAFVSASPSRYILSVSRFTVKP